jgi:proteasome beta subunit
MSGLVVMPLFCGYDHANNRGRIYKFDITGGRYKEREYYADGSGGKDARNSLKKTFASGLSRNDALRVSIEALMDAADEDRATGGVDVARGIFPIIKLATAAGIEEVTEQEIQHVYELALEARRNN